MKLTTLEIVALAEKAEKLFADEIKLEKRISIAEFNNKPTKRLENSLALNRSKLDEVLTLIMGTPETEFPYALVGELACDLIGQEYNEQSVLQ